MRKRRFKVDQMRARVLIQICLVIVWWPSPPAEAGVQSDLGPGVKSFLEFLRQEEEELEYQIRHREISRREYTRSKNRFAIMRETVLRSVKKTGQDIVPELHVVTASEIDQLIEKGMRALRGVRAGAIIEDKWRYLGRVSRGEVFYVFERLTKK
ncbi:MAG: hypothetical protein AB1631_22905 [Acidobacteriota bacterium]